MGEGGIIPDGAKVVIITLEDSTERQESATRHMAEMGIENFEFFRAKRHPLKGKVGCFISHAEVITRALSDPSCEYLYIFEDDLKPGPAYDRTIMAEVATWMTSPKVSGHWNAIYLGYTYVNPRHSKWGTLRFLMADYVSEHIVEYDGPILLLHALILSRAGMRHIAAACNAELRIHEQAGTLRQIIQFDQLVSDVLDKIKGMFCVVPMQIDQHWCMETANEINRADIIEVLARANACIAERMDLFTWLSYARPYRALFAIAVVLAVLAVVALFVPHNKLARPAAGGRRLRLKRPF